MKLSALTLVGLIITASLLLFTGLGIILVNHQLIAQQDQIDQQWTEVDQLYQSKLQILQELSQELEPTIGISEREILMNLVNSIQDYGASNQTNDRVAAAGYVGAAQERLEKIRDTYPQLQTSTVQTYFDRITEQNHAFEPAKNHYNQLVDSYNQQLTEFPYQNVANLFDISPENKFDPSAVTPELNVELPAATPGLESAAPIKLILPARSGFVIDVADIFPPSFEEKLERQLLATATTGKKTEVVVTSIPSLLGMPVELISEYLVENWQIGQDYEGRGVLFLIAVKDQVIRITPTAALANDITPERATTIINHQVASAFESEKHLQGVQDGVDSVLLLIEDPNTLNLPTTTVSVTSFDRVLMPFLWLIVTYLITIAGFLLFFYLIRQHGPWWAAVIFAAAFGFMLGQFQQVGLLTGLLFSLVAIWLTLGLKLLKR